MFNNLVESGSHRGDFARKGRFMLGTLALYGVLLTASGVAGVFAYDARLERQNFELTWMVTPVPFVPAAPPPSDDPPPRPSGGNDGRVATRTDLYADLRTTPRTPPPVSTERPNVPPVPPGVPTVRGATNFTPEGVVGPRMPNNGAWPGGSNPGDGGVRVRVPDTEDPRPPEVRLTPAPAATPRPERIRVPSSVISSKVIAKPAPPYPTIAKAARIQGTVNVEIVIDERGSVISARAVDGPAMLRVAAEQAARQARFTPTLLGGQPVKVSGVITYNFVLN